MSNSAPIAELVGVATGSRDATLRAIRQLVDVNRDARSLFLDEQGQMKPAAERIFGLLAREAGLDRLGEFQPDARLQDQMIGRQFIVRRLSALLDLDVRRLEELQRKLGR